MLIKNNSIDKELGICLVACSRRYRVLLSMSAVVICNLDTYGKYILRGPKRLELNLN